MRIYDPEVESARLVGGNRAYVELHLPHLSRLMVPSIDEVGACDIIVVGHPLKEDSLIDRWLGEGKGVLDLVGKHARADHPCYDGLYW